MNKQSKIRGSLIGGAIGDALGYQIEFQKGIRDKQVTSFLNGEGIISDDTQMTLFTANGLVFRERRAASKGIAMLPADALYFAYLDWFETQYPNMIEHPRVCWLNDVDALNVHRAPGLTCLNALKSGVKGTIEKPINDSKGCGTIMRIAPIGLYITEAEVGKVAAEASAITHGHPLAIIPSYVCATMIWHLAHTDADLEIALKKAVESYKANPIYPNSEYNATFYEIIEKAVGLAKNHTGADIEAIARLGGGWVAEEAFAIALYACLRYPHSFRDAIICAVNHDGDSDSTGAVAGNIIGAYLGYEAIPDEYKNHIELKETILKVADELAEDIVSDVTFEAAN